MVMRGVHEGTSLDEFMLNSNDDEMIKSPPMMILIKSLTQAIMVKPLIYLFGYHPKYPRELMTGNK